MTATPPRRLRQVILAKANSQLGNRLTMHAHLLAACRERGARLLNPTLGDYAAFFVGTHHRLALADPDGEGPDIPRRTRLLAYLATRLAYKIAKAVSLLPGFPVQAINVRRRWRDRRLREVLDHLDARGARLGFVQAWYVRDHDLCQKHAAAIRAVFTPLPHLRQRADAVIAGLRARNDLVLGVHVRHGDYRTHAGGSLFFDWSRYRAWMEEWAAAQPGRRVGFLIASDARPDADAFHGLDVAYAPGTRANDDFGNRPGGPVQAAIVEDNYALSCCDAILGTVSTFSSWAAFWGDRPLLQVRSADEHATPDRFVVPVGPD